MSPLRGAITDASARVVRGWAMRDDSVLPVDLVLRMDGKDIAKARADKATPAGLPPGSGARVDCGFEFRLPQAAALKGGEQLEIVAVPATLGSLPGTPLTYQPPPDPSQPSADEIEEMRSVLGRFPKVSRRSSGGIVRDSLYAFALREIRDRFGRSRWGYLWAIAQPIIFMLGFYAIRMALGRGRDTIYDVNGMYFFWLGLVPFFMFMNGLHRGMGSTRAYRALFQFRQVQPIDVIFVRVLFEFVTMIVVFTILISGFAWFGAKISVDDVLGFVAVLALLFAFTFGITLCAEICVILMPDSRQIINIIERPLLFLSGTFYTIDHVPPNARQYLLWNPLLHGVDLARGTMLAKYDPIGSWVYLLGCTLAVLALGLLLYRQYKMRMIEQ